MGVQRGVCFLFARFDVTEHKTNAYFSGGLARYADTGLGIRDWLHAGAKHLRIKSDPFTILEWQKQFLEDLQSSNDATLAAVLQHSLQTLRLHAVADVEETAQGMIQTFTAHLNYAHISRKQLEKIALRLPIRLHEKRVLTVPDLLEHLHEFPKALIASGPQDLIEASIDALELRRFFDCIHRSSDCTTTDHLEPVLECLGVQKENLLLVGWQSGADWASLPARHYQA